MKNELVRAAQAAVFVCACGLSAANAAVVGVTGSATSVAAPTSVAVGAYESDTQTRIFFERVRFTPVGIPVDVTAPGLINELSDFTPGSVGAGGFVQSYLLRSDSVSETSRVYEGSVTFDTDILGVIVQRSRIAATDEPLGSPTTTYADYNARGLEIGSDRFTLDPTMRTVTFRFVTGESSDEIRIITAIPSVSTLAPLAMVGVFMRRRRVIK
jgi:hypothetical protein